MTRISISEEDILKGNYSLNEKYVLDDVLYMSSFYLQIKYNIEFFNIDILIQEQLFLTDLPFLKSISKNIIVNKSIQIENCPLLKTIPFEVTFGKTIRFYEDQHLTTILSKEQFFSLEKLAIRNKKYEYIYQKHIFCKNNSDKEILYQEYYSLVKPTLIKNELMKACTL